MQDFNYTGTILLWTDSQAFISFFLGSTEYG